MSEFIRLQANGVDAYPDASTENTYRSNGTSVESALLALESNVNTLGGVAGEAKTLAEQNSVKIATAEQEISDINSSLVGFIDTKNIIKSSNDFTSYTAIQNCYISTIIYTTSNQYVRVLIDDNDVARCYTQGDDISFTFPLAKGQKLEISGQRGQHIVIYGMK